ncbi:MAG: M56 family metallopeptidase [Prevotella sp.]|nr:M56 family metallopeptidase [Prevotella sp.]
MMLYVLKSALLLTLLYGGFSILLSHETFHRFNRMVLIGIVLLSLVLPAVRISSNDFLPINLERYWQMKEVVIADDKDVVVASDEDYYYTPQQPTLRQTPYNDNDFWDIIYIIGVFFFLIRFIRRSFLLAHSLRGGLRLRDEQGNTIIVKGGEFPPFSFMHYIVISVNDYEQHQCSILTHEQAHARLGHSWDVLLLEMMQMVQWFNPFAWLLTREMKAIHEYEADEAVICQGIDAKQYQQLLVIKAVGNRLQLFANTLNRGSLKTRINMMQQTKSNRWRMLRAMFAIPVAVLALVAFATPEMKESEVQPEAIKTNGSQVEDKPLVEYKEHQKWGKGYRDYYIVHLPQGVWIESGRDSYIEELIFNYSFGNSRHKNLMYKATMMLNGVPFDQNSLPKLTSSELKKMEIKIAENTIIEGESRGTDLAVNGKHTTVNLITTPITIPASVRGNRTHTETRLPVTGKTKETASMQSAVEKEQQDDLVFDVCEQLPRFPGGEVEMMQFIAKNIKYPKEAIECGIQGRVKVQFVVEKDGSLTNLRVVESSQDTSEANMITVNGFGNDKERQDAETHNAGVQALRDEALRVVKAMPRWTPGKQQGKVVRVKYTVPVTYRLN